MMTSQYRENHSFLDRGKQDKGSSPIDFSPTPRCKGEEEEGRGVFPFRGNPSSLLPYPLHHSGTSEEFFRVSLIDVPLSIFPYRFLPIFPYLPRPTRIPGKSPYPERSFPNE